MIDRLATSSAELIYWSIACAMLAAFVATLVVLQFDARTIDGYTSVWTKPLKFELSLALHAATLGLAVNLLSPIHRRDAMMLLVAVAFLAACTVEMGYIIVQGARGQHSHFNVGTPFHRMMYSVMGFAAVIIVGAAGAVGLACMADAGFTGSPALKTAIFLGFLGGTVLTLITAFTIGGRMSPYVGDVPDFGARMALTGWSRSSGDLRVSHFLATHMIQIVPLVGLMIERIVPGRVAILLVVGFAALWTLVTMQEYGTALTGKPSRMTTASW
jgi:uncharacterized membrane protein YuzA (DUF378 family)